MKYPKTIRNKELDKFYCVLSNLLSSPMNYNVELNGADALQHTELQVIQN